MSLSQQLESIDEQIAVRRQQINVLRLEIAQLEDHRRTTLWLEEQRLGQVPGVQPLNHHQRELLTGHSERPMVVVRDATDAEQQEALLSHARKYGTEEPAPKRKYAGRQKGYRVPGSQQGVWTQRVLSYLRDSDEPARIGDIANYYGLPTGELHRKPLSNAIYNLKRGGLIVKGAGKPGARGSTYQLAPQAAGNGAAAH